MDIGILTYYGVHNHGAVLQANALQLVLKNMGHRVRLLTFVRSYEYIPLEQKKKYSYGLSSIPYYIKYMIDKGVGSIVFNFKKRRLLERFKSNQFDLSTSYDTFDGDVVLVGSDEVFSLEIGYNPMMYGYGLKAKRVSYAGSFGPTKLDDIENKKRAKLISDGLKSFDAISVRDQNSRNIVKSLCAIDVPIVCDPVLLYGYEREKTEFTPSETDYIVIYAYDSRMNSPEEIKLIREYAQRHNLKIFSVGFYHKWCDKNINADPIELLGWINNAFLTITDTFHGTVLSIICNTPMVVKIRENGNKLAYLLEEFELSSRIIETFDDLEETAKKQIDFEAVNQKAGKKRAESMHFLMNAIGG